MCSTHTDNQTTCGHYEYGSQHTVGGSSSQPNLFGSSSQTNPFGSSSQPNFSELFRKEHSPVEEVEEIQVRAPKNRRRQTSSTKKPQNEKGEEEHCYPWTPEEETALCKGWVRTSEDSVVGNGRKERGGADDADYLQRALTDYHVEYRVPFTLLHCWEVLKLCDKLNRGEVLEFLREGGERTRDTSRTALVRLTRRSQEKEVSI
ncbi:hypothetical protein Tco_1347642 [Tanacetum coccineum]